jgi:hypothetical protein
LPAGHVIHSPFDHRSTALNIAVFIAVVLVHQRRTTAVESQQPPTEKSEVCLLVHPATKRDAAFSVCARGATFTETFLFAV